MLHFQTDQCRAWDGDAGFAAEPSDFQWREKNRIGAVGGRGRQWTTVYGS